MIIEKTVVEGNRVRKGVSDDRIKTLPILREKAENRKL